MLKHPKPSPTFLPVLLTTLRGYTSSQFLSDLTAGVIVGIVALPLAIAFAIASGVTPDRGIVTAIIAGFLISILGGSRVQIGGPTGAFVVIVYKIVQQYGVDGLLICSLMAGVMLILMGVFRLGTVIRYIPYPLTVGFTSGIAVVIFSSQVKDFFGLTTGALPADFVEKWEVYGQAFHTLDPTALLLSLLSLGIIIAWPRVSRRIPGSIVAITLVTALVHFLGLSVETIGSKFGDIPAGLPRPALPAMTFSQIKHLVGPAFTVALLGAIESLLSATVTDGMIGGRHRSNTELIAQGIANVITPLFGGIPATGAIARSATNVKNGGRTPVAGVVHALTLLLIVLIFGRWAGLIPLCVLSAILVVVCYHMSEWRAFRALLKAPRSDVAVLVTTFALTVLIDLTVAVEIGMLLSLALFMKRMTDVSVVRDVSREPVHGAGDERLGAGDAQLPEGTVIYEAEGAFFFGIAEKLRDLMEFGSAPPPVMVLRMRNVLALDATALRAIEDLFRTCRASGTRLILTGVRHQPVSAMKRAGLFEKMGEINVQVAGR